MSKSEDTSQPICLVKGTVLHSLLKFIFEELNEAQKERLFSQLDEEYKDKIVNNKILSTDQVPVSLLNRLTIATARIKGEPVKIFARKAGRFSAEEGMKGIYRIFGKVQTANMQVSKASIIWSNLYDRGKMETIMIDSKTVMIRLTEIATEQVMCERIYGWLERTNQLAGLMNVKVLHKKCYSLGHPHCEWEISWKK